MLFTLYVLFLSTSSFAQSPDPGYFYYSHNRQIPLTLSTEYVGVRFAPGTYSSSYLNQFSNDPIAKTGHKHLEQHELTLLKTAPGLAEGSMQALHNNMRSQPEVELVLPVFSAPGALMLVTQEFIAQFSAHTSEREINALNAQHKVDIVQKASWADDTFILKTRGGDCLKTANLYHQLPEVVYAHPDFVRIMPQSPQASHDPNQRTVYGPSGEILPPDTVIDKVASGYRVVEPCSETLPQPIPSTFMNMSPVAKNTIKSETFEGAFPNEWHLLSRNESPVWDDVSNRKYAGAYSGYCVGSSPDPGPEYPNNADSWMIFGPFSLAQAQDARLAVQTWIDTEPGYDFFSIMASTNGSNFYGRSWSGDWVTSSGGNGWMNIMFDLTNVYNLGNLCGEQQVWVALQFTSDYYYTLEGAYVDNVVVEQITGGYQNLTNDAYDHLQWSLDNNGQLWGSLGADIAWSQVWPESTADDVVIAIIDEGVDLGHPDLNLVSGYDATNKNLNGAPEGDDAHGTNCAGIAAAITNNNKGIAGIAGSARIMPIRIAYDDGDGNWVTTDSWIAGGIAWAENHGADVLSNSWGGGSPSNTVTNAINSALNNGRNGRGSVVVFATGNNNSAISYPATLNQVISVGALSPCDERKSPTSCDGENWWGSNFGSQIDISAPGVHMYSTDIQGSAGYSQGDYFARFNGTSSATPVVSGVAALVLGADPSLSPTQVRNILVSNADDLGPSGWDPYTGYGRVNAFKSVPDLTSTTNIVPVFNLLLNDDQ